ncbi:uncharacterized protein [Nicotiana sylvestris]|uniref:uncharacterized protein n=1 Tax=Nicotiana sylvestris TaxID=4096 RepID=UPI00388C40A8
MVDDKPIMEQVHEYENLTADVLNKVMEMCEILRANVLLENFPPSWSDYRNQLKHKKKNLTLQELINHMRTEEANRLKDKESEWLKNKMKSLSLNSSKANLVKSSHTFVKDRFKGKQKKGQKKCNQTQGLSSKNGGKAPVQANLTEGGDVTVVVVVEANMVANKTDWILDTCASRHLCANKELFHDFEESADGECVYMGNSTTARVMGKGKILLKLTFGKTLALNNVLFMSLNDSSICESRDAEFFEHVFPLKTNMPSDVPNNASTSMSVNSHIVPSSSVTANEHKNELRRSKRRRIEANFGPDFITTFLTENIDLDVLSDELVLIYLIEEDSKTYSEENKVCKLRKSMYGLKQAPKQWYERFNNTLVGNSFVVNASDLMFIPRWFNCFDVAPVRTPYDPSTHLRNNKKSSISQTEYAKIITGVMFLMNYTRPDIAYVVSRLKGFCDANWVTDNDEVSSTSGYVFTLGAGAISWKSSKLTCIARSNMESEFIALRLAGKKLSG